VRRRLKHFGLNARSFVYAIAIHAFVGVLLFASFNWDTVVVATPKPRGPEPVKATVVSEADIQKQLEAIKEQEDKKKEEELKAKKRLEDMVREAKAAEKKRKAEQQKLADLEKKKKQEQKTAALEAQKRKTEELRLAKLKEEQERKKKAEVAERKKREAQKKREAEEKRRKELAEKKRKEQELAANKRKDKELAEKRKQELAEKRQREAELQARLEEERVQRLVNEALARYTPIIQQKVSRNWSRPPGAQVGLSARVRVRLTPTGEVVSARVMRSSGNTIFDRSVENAVLKASPLPIPQEQKLNDRFREIQFNFNPDEKLISKL